MYYAVYTIQYSTYSAIPIIMVIMKRPIMKSPIMRSIIVKSHIISGNVMRSPIMKSSLLYKNGRNYRKRTMEYMLNNSVFLLQLFITGFYIHVESTYAGSGLN